MTSLTLQLPDEVFSALRRSPEEFVRELRLAAAVHWYLRREISQEKAAQVAGLNCTSPTPCGIARSPWWVSSARRGRGLRLV